MSPCRQFRDTLDAQVCQTPRSSRARAMQALDAEFVGEMCGAPPSALAEPKHQVHLHLRPTQDEAQRNELEIQVPLVCVCVYVYKLVYMCVYVCVY